MNIPKHAFLLCTLAFSINAFAADPILAPWPAPGGTTYSASGTNVARAGGLTFTYGGFDTSMYDKLYFAIGDYAPAFDAAGPSLYMDNSRDVLSFDASASNLAAGISVWSGATDFFSYNYGWQSIATRFTVKITDIADNPLALTSVAAIAGLPASLGAVLDVNGDFKANMLFEADGPDGLSWEASLDMHDSGRFLTDQAYLHVNSVGGAFYYTEPVPEPETYALMLVGLGLVGYAARRNQVRFIPPLSLIR